MTEAGVNMDEPTDNDDSMEFMDQPGFTGSPKDVVGTSIMAGTAPIYSEGPYSVYVARIVQDEKKDDMDHYLIVQDDYGVIEGSFNRLIEARATCWALANAAFEQNIKINNAQPLVNEEPKNPNVAGRNKTWN